MISPMSVSIEVTSAVMTLKSASVLAICHAGMIACGWSIKLPVFWTHSDAHAARGEDAGKRFRQMPMAVVDRYLSRADFGRDDVDGWGTDEAGYKEISWRVVELIKGANLLDDAITHHYQAITHEDRLLLIVGDVDGGDVEFTEQFLNLAAGLLTVLGIEIYNWLIHQKYDRIAYDTAGDGYTLLLSTR
jgi:hypothetical protein